MTFDAPAHASTDRSAIQPTMADVFAAMPVDPAALVAAVHQQVQQQAPLLPVNVPGFDDEPRMRPLPYRDPLSWLLLKHAAQVALMLSALFFALQGGRAPLMAISYVATALLLMCMVVVADRLRFADRDPAFEIVEFLAPPPMPAPVHQPRHAPLAPLVEQMQVVLPAHVDVT